MIFWYFQTWPLLCLTDWWHDNKIFQGIFLGSQFKGEWCLVLVFQNVQHKAHVIFSPQQPRHFAREPNALRYISMLYSEVQGMVPAYFIKQSSLLQIVTKRIPQGLIWKRGKYHFLIFSNYNPLWLVIPATPSSFTSSSPLPPTWWGKKISHSNIPLCFLARGTPQPSSHTIACFSQCVRVNCSEQKPQPPQPAACVPCLSY